MTRKLSIILIALIILIVLAITYILLTNNIDNNTNIDDGTDSKYTFKATVLQVTGSTLLVEPKEEEEVRKSSDKISVNMYGINNVPELGEGDIVLISYNGLIMESYPAQLVADKIVKLEDKIAEIKEDSKKLSLFKALIDDIMKQDSALNEPFGFIAINFDSIINPNKDNISEKDLAKYNKLYKIDDEEKGYIISYCEQYTNDIKDSNFDKLKEEGLFNEKELHIENGILIYAGNIKNVKEDSIEIEFAKYRGGLGAIFSKYKATYSDGKWNLEIIEMAIA